VRHLARLTVALAALGKAALFGPGTQCRCAECTDMPSACAWSKGPYPGVLLLYMQELAVNTVLRQEEWDNLPTGLFDQGVSSSTQSVCGPALLHCYQHQELFSKLAFAAGAYRHYDMGGLDLTLARDYAAYTALHSNGQGTNSSGAVAALAARTGGRTLVEWCANTTRTTGQGAQAILRPR